VLFLDEMPELPRQSLEALRAPIETGRTTVARAAAHVTYPARFQLVAAMNPCRCGHLGDATRECGRAPRCGEDYLGKISGPMLDRIDLCVQVQPVTASEIARTPAGESSRAVSVRIAQSRKRQHARQDGRCNAEADVDQLELSDGARDLAEQASGRLRLSARGFTRLLRVSRTIADLAASEQVERSHVAEALTYRHRVCAGR
jgi:magnesium chelatase family protein